MDWDDARYFLAVARSGQMLGASKKLGVSQALLSRRIAALEAAVGVRLLDRTTRGSTLTKQGQIMFEAAERIEMEMAEATANLRSSEDALSGTIRIGAPDGFGSIFLAPRLKSLRAAFPNLHIQLVPVARNFSLSEREADVAVMIGRPDRGRIRVRRLTDYTLSLYASRAYLEEAGTPRALADLSAHTLVGYVEDLIHTKELNYAYDFLDDWRSDIEVSTAIGQLEVIRSGGGIGVLHDFMAIDHPDLMRLFPQMMVQRTYWTVWHENLRAARRINVLSNFLDEAVRANRRRFLPFA